MSRVACCVKPESLKAALVPRTRSPTQPAFVVLNLGGARCRHVAMRAVMSEGSAVAIWKRAIEPEAGDLPPAEARAILRLRLAETDLVRADALAAKARAGQLSAQEHLELDNYLTVGSVLEFLKSKARRSLRKTEAHR